MDNASECVGVEVLMLVAAVVCFGGLVCNVRDRSGDVAVDTVFKVTNGRVIP